MTTTAQKIRIGKENDDQVFALLFEHMRSRTRVRNLILALRAIGFEIVKQAELEQLILIARQSNEKALSEFVSASVDAAKTREQSKV